MATPFLLAQLSDPHIGADWEGIDPAPRLRAAVAAVLALPNPVDAVIVSGDLAANGAAAEYERAREMLAPLGPALHVLPGNHDDRDQLRTAFELDGEPGAPIDYAVELGPLRLLALDSTVPGQDPGGFEAAQLDWLEGELAAHPERPTLLAMHHSPLATGIADWDGVNLGPAERRSLAAVLARHPQLLAIVGGHLHRVAASTLAGRPVLSVPSTYLQARPDFATEAVAMVGDRPGFALHAFRDGELASQVETID